jgi:hypothetical protein
MRTRSRCTVLLVATCVVGLLCIAVMQPVVAGAQQAVTGPTVAELQAQIAVLAAALKACQGRAIKEADAAQYIGLSQAFLRAARAGRGTPGPAYVRAGRAVRYLIVDLDFWLASHRIAA